MADCTCDSMNISKQQLFIPHRLRNLLSTVKTINTISTLEEVLWAIKDYISERTLFDLTDPKIINVAKDELGSVLGVPSFSLPELKRILLRLILKENVETVEDLQKTLQATNSKRKSDGPEILPLSSPKQLCLENLGMLSSSVFAKMKLTAPQLLSNKIYIQTSDSEDAVFHRMQSDLKNLSEEGQEVGHYFETEKILAIKHMYSLEYDVDTESSSNESETSVSDTESDVEEILQATFECVTNTKLNDEDCWADESSEECSDLEISQFDCWLCSECGTTNKPPRRYCLKCWEERKGWVAPQTEHSDKRAPPRHRRKFNRSEQADKKYVENDANIANHPGPHTSKAFVLPLSSSPNIISSQCDSSKQNTFIKDEKLCILCCSKPMNATVVHGKIGHQFCCYRCARKLQSLKKPCPICRRSIDRVIHQIVFE